MKFDLSQIAPGIAYKILTATVTPRPIAWVSTMDKKGQVNAAPFSFFNVMGQDPPIVALGLMGDPQRGFKDTARNILETGEFVVNLVPHALGPAMNETAIDAPFGTDELQLAGLGTTPSEKIRPPRITESPVAFECVNHSSVVTGPHQTVVLGRVLAIHVADRYVINAERGHIDNRGLDLIARSFGSEYIRSDTRFEMQRPKWADRQAEPGGKV
ncbi:MAG: flavin reductase family protein [Pseudorhodobacter sp.]